MCLRVCTTGDDFGTILIEPSVSRTANLISFTDSTPCSRIAISSSDRSPPLYAGAGDDEVSILDEDRRRSLEQPSPELTAEAQRSDATVDHEEHEGRQDTTRD
jgi:hypothetical protein